MPCRPNLRFADYDAAHGDRLWIGAEFPRETDAGRIRLPHAVQEEEADGDERPGREGVLYPEREDRADQRDDQTGEWIAVSHSATTTPTTLAMANPTKGWRGQDLQELCRNGPLVSHALPSSRAKDFDSPFPAYMVGPPVPIPFSKKSRRNLVQASENGGKSSSTRVGLRPERRLA